MNERTYIDPRCTREGWPSHEWDGEPDKVEWRDADTGLPCIAKRQPTSGHWCGYVGVPPGHQYHGKDYGDVYSADPDIEVHGGLTFADECQEGPPEEAICHVPEPGEPDHVWWLGFDCHHAWDLAPSDFLWRDRHGWPIDHDKVYRNLPYVRSECRYLARQIARGPVNGDERHG